jgi:hypothetical protein
MSFEGASIKGTCALVGIEPEKKTFAEVFPAPESGGVLLRLARLKDSTCLYVRVIAEEGS